MSSRWWMALLVGLTSSMTSGAVSAEEGWSRTDWIFRAGISRVDPRSTSLTLASGDRVVVEADDGVSFDATLLVRQRWGLEIFAAPALRHPLRLRGVAGLSDFGQTDQVLEILSAQYHLNPEGRFRPYLGVGLAYAGYSDSSPAGIDLDRSFGPALQAGLDIGLSPRWFLNFVVRWADIDTGVSLSGSELGSARIDPMIYSANIGFRLGESSSTRSASARSSAKPSVKLSAAPSATSSLRPAASQFFRSAPPPPPPPTLARARLVESALVGPDDDGDGVDDETDRCPATLWGLRVDARGCE